MAMKWAWQEAINGDISVTVCVSPRTRHRCLQAFAYMRALCLRIFLRAFASFGAYQRAYKAYGAAYIA